MNALLKHINIFIGIIILLAFLFVAKAINNNYKIKYSRLEKTMLDMEKKQELVAQLSHLDKEFNNLKKKIFKGGIIDFKHIIEKEASKRSIDVVSFKPQEEKGNDEYRKVKFVLQLNSGFLSFKDFVRSLESLGCVEVRSLRKARQDNKYYLEIIVFLRR